MTYYPVDPAVLRASAESQRHSEQVAHARRAATAAEESAERLSSLLTAMEQNLAIAKSAQEAAEKSERHSRIISWSSLAIGLASLGAAIVAIVVSV
ncbi:hypothetical protein ELQ90_03135 [Labedella phragmitis]|uniref:Uncharacterized protein n=1 Tax=Labedella phragmitis TaxID=2498849 RepID=A0A444PYH7_9MICO|nr:hypothetical protein [Labedella phragmitis]RWZ52944.1 hypothetical protein ELQ90_03135 [Labedella phragmitis]